MIKKFMIFHFTILLPFFLFLSFCGRVDDNPFRVNINLPKSILIYYGWPNGINDAHIEADPIVTAAEEFGKYDYVVLGGGIEKVTHPAHDATVQIISHEYADNTVYFGYIDLGVSTDNHSMTEIKTRVDEWIETGIDGIFFDDFGYDFSVSRGRQNEAVSYVHLKGMPVIANAWNPDDAFSGQYDPNYNPDNTATVLNASDFYFYESYQITMGNYETKKNWRRKMGKLKEHQKILNFKVLGVTTNDKNNLYYESKFFYTWHSALIDELEAVGWGEYNFAANGNARFRTRPDDDYGKYFISNVIEDSDLFYRNTEKGQIRINTATHEYEFYSNLN